MISPWNVDDDETRRQLTFVGDDVKKELVALTIEEDHESVVVGEKG